MTQTKKGMLFEAVAVILLILLSFTLYVMVTSTTERGWSVSGVVSRPNATEYGLYGGQYQNMFLGENGIVYTVDSRNVHAIDAGGRILWSLAIPDAYREHISGRDYNVSAIGPMASWNGISATVQGGVLYLLLVPTESAYITGALLAIAPDGHLLWGLPYSVSLYTTSYDGSYGYGYPQKVEVKGGQIYVMTWDGISAVADNGSVLWHVYEDTYSGSFTTPSADDRGNVYALSMSYEVAGHYDVNETYPRQENALYANYTSLSYHPNGTIMGGNFNVIIAYGPDGIVKWRKSFRDDVSRLSTPYVNYFDEQPAYRNGTIYVWFRDGVLALDRNGSYKWYRAFDPFYIDQGWFDSNDSLYLLYAEKENGSLKWPPNSLHVSIIGNDGNVTTIPDCIVSNYSYIDIARPVFYNTTVYSIKRVAPYKLDDDYLNASHPYPWAGERIKFYLGYPYDWQQENIEAYLKVNNGTWDFPRHINGLDTYEISAYDITSGRRLWSYTIPLHKRRVILDRANVDKILFAPEYAYKDNNGTPDQWYRSMGIPAGAKGIAGVSRVNLLPTDDTLFVNFWSYNYEVPAFFNRSACVYSGGLFAIDKNGTLLWDKQIYSQVIDMEVTNGTVYYSTGDNKISAMKAELAAGALAALYIFIRFFLLGAISKSRDRLNKNNNRNKMLGFIADNPGTNLKDICGHLKVNKGTARYHLLLLSLNHKVAPYREDNNYIRYFPRSPSYSPDEQFIISLLRRDNIGKTLNLLLEKPGLSNADISRALGVQESVACRFMKELLEKGIVTKDQMGDGRLSYSVKKEYEGPVGLALKRLGGP